MIQSYSNDIKIDNNYEIKFCLWDPESLALESRIQLKQESGITLMIGIQNLSSTDQEAGIQYLADPESTAWNRLSWIPIHGTSHRSSYLNVSSSFCFIS